MNEKVNKLEQEFLHFQHNLSKEATQKRDLDEAMGDIASANKERVKIDMFSRSIDMFRHVKNNGDFYDVKNSFMHWLDEEREGLEQLILQAKAEENAHAIVENQIRKSVLSGPIGGIFKYCVKKAQQS